MLARVSVTLKTGVLDPQGKAIEGALHALGHAAVASVRQGKIFDVELSEQDPDAARSALRQVCEALLANTVIEDYEITLGGPQADATPLAGREP